MGGGLRFGLLHGFGFAGALAEVGLPQTAIPVALLMFNVGVEVGQLLFVAAVVAIARCRASAADASRMESLAGAVHDRSGGDVLGRRTGRGVLLIDASLTSPSVAGPGSAPLYAFHAARQGAGAGSSCDCN